jgi:hypothetical protein
MLLAERLPAVVDALATIAAIPDIAAWARLHG